MTSRVTGPRRPSTRARKTLTRPGLHTVSATAGARAAADWFTSLGLRATKPWYVEIALDVSKRPARATYSGDSDTRFHLNVYPEEWGVYFCHGSRASWIRVTDEPFVHGRDDYSLLDDVPKLGRIRQLVRALEKRHRIAFQRDHALIRTNIVGGKRRVREWLETL